MRKYDINIFISVIPRNDTTPTYKLKLKKLDVKDHIPLQEIVKKKKKKNENLPNSWHVTF